MMVYEQLPLLQTHLNIKLKYPPLKILVTFQKWLLVNNFKVL